MSGSKKIIISCAGLGMGNASRISAILQRLNYHSIQASLKIECFIFSSGAGADFLTKFLLNERLNIATNFVRLEKYQKKNYFKNITTYYKNTACLGEAIKEIKPDLIILDSDYHCFAYNRTKIPIYFIGQAIDVLDRAKKEKFRPNGIKEKLSLLVVEKADVFYQKLVSSLIFVPSFALKMEANPKIIKIPLIVRDEFLNSKIHRPDNLNGIKIGGVLSGSGIEQEFFLKLKRFHKLNLIFSNPNEVQLTSPLDYDSYDLVITQGGLSSISEAISRNKFLIVIPIKGHAEQILNAVEVEAQGLGKLCQTHSNFNNLIAQEHIQPAPNSIDCSGANWISTHIIKYLFPSSYKG